MGSTISAVGLAKWLALTYGRKYYPHADIVLFSFKGIKPAYIWSDTGASLAAGTPPLNDCRYAGTRERHGSGMQLPASACREMKQRNTPKREPEQWDFLREADK